MKRINNYLTDCLPTIMKYAVMVVLVLLSASLVNAKPQNGDGGKGASVLRIIYSGGIKGNIKPCG